MASTKEAEREVQGEGDKQVVFCERILLCRDSGTIMEQRGVGFAEKKEKISDRTKRHRQREGTALRAGFVALANGDGNAD